MKRLSIIILIALASCSKPEYFELTVTNTDKIERQFRLDHEKKLIVLQPQESYTLILEEDYYHVQLVNYLNDSIYVNSDMQWP